MLQKLLSQLFTLVTSHIPSRQVMLVAIAAIVAVALVVTAVIVRTILRQRRRDNRGKLFLHPVRRSNFAGKAEPAIEPSVKIVGVPETPPPAKRDFAKLSRAALLTEAIRYEVAWDKQRPLAMSVDDADKLFQQLRDKSRTQDEFAEIKELGPSDHRVKAFRKFAGLSEEGQVCAG
ncbi:hypothetical protein KW785_00670 [Candidatus Parcubacteria bacterium]|nr:hypothetical protein [Candidatus Parcubacteria bacterium]